MSETTPVPWTDISDKMPRKPYEGGEKLEARGAVVILRNMDTGLIYAATEKVDKERIGRTKGSVTVISETGKLDESLIDNFIGALGEYPLKSEDSIHISPDYSYIGVYPLNNKGEAHVFVVDIVTQTESFEGMSTIGGSEVDSEVTPLGWFSLEDLLDEPNLRAGMRGLLNWAGRSEKLGHFVGRNTTGDLVLDDVDAMTSYILERERSGLVDDSGNNYSQ